MLIRPGKIIADRYEIIEQIGSGGMAIVYMARDTKLDRFVTFKVLKEEHLSDEFVFSKFNTEARAAASLSNQHIVNIYDVGVEGDIHYIVMEYIDGITLKELINTRAPFEPEETLGVAIQIAQALSHAHQNKVVHQDIKPQNILISERGVVKVTDFGIASAQAVNSSTTTNSTVGSIHYFSPEQAQGRYVDQRSDIYSLGIVMFEMATGTLPFEGDSSVSVALKHINEPLPPMEEFNPGISQSLKKIITKATGKNTNSRYISIEEMMDDLKLAITNPTGDFVTNTDVSPTIKINGDELLQIQNKAQDYDDYGYEEYEEEYYPPERTRGHRKPEPPDEEEYYPPERTRGYRKPDPPDFDIFKKQPEGKGSFQSIEKKIIFIAIGTAAAIILIIGIIALLELFNQGDEAVVHTMPNLINLTLEEAANAFDSELLALLGEGFMTYTEDHNADVAEGLIFEQTPAAGTVLSEDSRVSLLVSLGSAFFEIPDFVGLGFNEAQLRFDNLNLPFSMIPSFIVSDYPVGTVFDQSPEPGLAMPPDSIITLVVSLGGEAVQINVENFEGMTEEEAVARIAMLGLSLGTISRAYNDDLFEGIVISQTIPEGNMVPPDTAIGLFVSLGPHREEPPEVVIPEDEPDDLPPEPPIIQGNYTLIFHVPTNFADMEEVNLGIVLTTDAGMQTIFDSPVHTEDMRPFIFNIPGTGTGRLSIFINGHPVSDDEIQFAQ